MSGEYSTHGRKENASQFLSKTLKKRDHVETVNINGGIVLKSNGRLLTGFSCLRLETSGELLYT
jgi:hypothetical protein